MVYGKPREVPVDCHSEGNLLGACDRLVINEVMVKMNKVKAPYRSILSQSSVIVMEVVSIVGTLSPVPHTIGSSSD